MRRAAPFLILSAFLFAALPASEASDEWWDNAWKRRLVLEIQRYSQTWKDSPYIWVKFHPGTSIMEGGGDVRVFHESGNELPVKVIFAEPGKECEVVFRANKRQGKFYLYYGNRKAPEPTKVIKNIDRGFMLETRVRPRGRCMNVAEWRKLWNASPKVYGKGVIRAVSGRHGAVWDGYNPFGPENNYLSYYHGYINIPRDGQFTFATASDDGSFLLIDGKVVVEWPGNHGAGAGIYGGHNGNVRLKKGMHKFEYMHEDGLGGQCCVAGWKRPGDKQFSLIPVLAFPGFQSARVVATECLGKPAAARASFSRETLWRLDKGNMILVRFRQEGVTSENGTKFQWSFGDGATSTLANPDHVYLNDGVYNVKLTVTKDGKSDTTTIHLDMTLLFLEMFTRRTNVYYYIRVASGYDFSKLSTRDLKQAIGLFRFKERKDMEIPVYRELVKRKNDLPEREYYDVLLQLGDLLLSEGVEKDAAEAEALFRSVIDHKPKVRDFWRTFAMYGDAAVDFVLRGKPQPALKKIERLIGNVESLPKHVARRSLVLKGDIMRELGNAAEAGQAYLDSKKYLFDSPDPRDTAARRGAYGTSVENYIHRREFDAAFKEIEKWEMYFPEDKLEGYLSVLKSRLWLFDQTKYHRSIRELKALLTCSPHSNYADEAVLAIAKTYVKLRNYDAAGAAVKLFMEKYPESPLMDEAGRLQSNIERASSADKTPRRRRRK
ncbi:MAG: PKD domain-containing protein [Planctomycetota bacterium]|jgi:hypothetical protein